MTRTKTLFSCLSLFFLTASGIRAEVPPKPKYGPLATTLSQSHEYFRAREAPDFWAIIPYYAAQQDGRSCSVASVAMIVNAARAGQSLTAEDPLITQKEILKRAGNSVWKKGVGSLGRGVTLEQLKPIVEDSLRAYGFVQFDVEVVHTPDFSQATADRLRAALAENEKSANDFIILNFLQGAYTGDADVGHIAPVGAYDAAKRRVLVMDPDREWYEPYWVSESTLLAGMATSDKESGKSRGYLRIRNLRAPHRK